MPILTQLTQPLRELLAPADTTEIVMNRYGRALRERAGRWEDLPPKHFDKAAIDPLIAAINSYSHGNLSQERPLLSATLPSGERIQIVIPPATDEPAFALRKPGTLQMDLDQYEAQGAFDFLAAHAPGSDQDAPPDLDNLNAKHFLQAAVRDRQTIIIAGGTGTGKTTFFNALARHIPTTERLISIEDAREIQLTQPNTLHLVTQRGSQYATFLHLLEACLRLRPDRILAAELRGAEAFTFLRAVNTGHPGSMTTVHANDCAGVLQQLMLMLSQANTGLHTDVLRTYLERSIDLIVQLVRQDGRRFVSQIWRRGALLQCRGTKLSAIAS